MDWGEALAAGGAGAIDSILERQKQKQDQKDALALATAKNQQSYKDEMTKELLKAVITQQADAGALDVNGILQMFAPEAKQEVPTNKKPNLSLNSGQRPSPRQLVFHPQNQQGIAQQQQQTKIPTYNPRTGRIE